MGNSFTCSTEVDLSVGLAVGGRLCTVCMCVRVHVYVCVCACVCTCVLFVDRCIRWCKD